MMEDKLNLTLVPEAHQILNTRKIGGRLKINVGRSHALDNDNANNELDGAVCHLQVPTSQNLIRTCASNSSAWLVRLCKCISATAQSPCWPWLCSAGPSCTPVSVCARSRRSDGR